MIDFHGEFKACGAEGSVDVQATGQGEAIVVTYLVVGALLALGYAIGYCSGTITGYARRSGYLSK